MVEISITIFTTISTIIVVTMATIFFCCWRKKGTGDINEDKGVKKETKKEASPAPCVGRAENGVVSDTRGPQAFVDTNDDLGDFSAVQRETEILRSYRKPPPPKNRARQSRAPRAFKSSQEKLDIFTELIEEDKIDSDNKENIDSTEDVDTALLRPKSEGKEATTRDARSSMLADIEQTLAAMHMSQPSTENSKLKDTESPTREGDKPLKADNTQEKEEKRKSGLCEAVKESSVASGDSVSSTTSSVPPEVKTPSGTSSPKSSPIPKPKRGPKVSPKPNPKVKANLSTESDKSADSKNLDVPSEGKDTASVLEQKAAESSGVDATVTKPSSPQEESSSPANGLPKATFKEVPEAITDKDISSEKHSDQPVNGSRDSPASGTSRPNSGSSEKRISNMTNSSTDSHKSSESTRSSKSSKAGTPDRDSPTATEINNDNNAASASDADPQVTSPSDAAADENQATQPDRDSYPTDSSSRSEESPSPTSQRASRSEVKGEVQPAFPERDVQQQAKSTSPSRTDGAGKQRRESSEDQSKGKTSKIPVRAGSKTRASPPRAVSGEKPGSPTN